MGEIGEEAIVMFEESGVGAEEVVSSNDYELCFVDTAAVSWPSSSKVAMCSLIIVSSPEGW